MSKDVLKIISDSMLDMGLAYEFMEWGEKTVYPYFTGEYQESESMNEDGMQETSFILTGHSRGQGSWLLLEEAKEKIKKYFPKTIGKLVTTDSGSVVAVFYAYSLPIATVVGGLGKIQINLTIKEWSVN